MEGPTLPDTRSTTRLALLAALLLAFLAFPLSAAAVCGDATLDPGEECDDGNTTAADGCSPLCRFEQACVVTNDFGSPGSVTVTKLSRDGALSPVASTALPGSHAVVQSPTAARCGRFVYVINDGNIEGVEVGLDGTLTPLAGAADGQLLGLLCNESAGLLFAFRDSPSVFDASDAVSYTVGPSGALTLADEVVLTGEDQIKGIFPDFHPTTGELYVLSHYLAIAPFPPNPIIEAVELQRISYDAAGTMTVEQTEILGGARRGARGMRLTRDAGFLGIAGFTDPAAPMSMSPTFDCFAHFEAPGATIPPFANLDIDCATLPGDPTGFVVRPDGGPIFYYQSDGGPLQSVAFSGASILPQSSITPTHETRQLLAEAYGGEVLVSLGPSELATYRIAPNQTTLTPRDALALAADPSGAELVACPALGPVMGVPVPTWIPPLLVAALAALSLVALSRRRTLRAARFSRSV